jgi:DNA repair exonuclease SbcCD ATPase subunit
MLQALDAQFKRAETLIQREEEAARRVDESIERLSRRFESLETGTVVSTSIDADEIERTANEAVARITTAADDAARQLHGRLERFVALDSRLDELDATLRTVERRLERLPEPAPAGRQTTPVAPAAAAPITTSSGSLSIEPRVDLSASASPNVADTTLDDSNPELATAIRLQLLVDRGEEVRRELRSDLEAICTASASLVEIVERASETERTLRGTLEADATRSIAPASDDDRASAGWSIASILRRLADEFDANESATGASPSASRPPAPAAALVARSIAAIAPTTPVELDVSPTDGHPVRREPLAAPDVTIDPVGAIQA